MLKKRAIKTLASIVFESILVTCIPFKLFADSLPRSVSLEASEGVTAEFTVVIQAFGGMKDEKKLFCYSGVMYIYLSIWM